MKKIVTGIQIVMLLTSISCFSQATFSKEMIERNLKEKKMREDIYKASQVENEKNAEQGKKDKAKSDSIVKVKDLELKKIKEDKENKRIEELASQEMKAKENEIRENASSEDKNKENFTFDKIALERLEKELKYSNYYDEKKKEVYSSLIPDDDADFRNNPEGAIKFVKISSFLPTDKFVGTSWSTEDNSYSIIKNVKTQKLYAIHTFVRHWEDYSAGSVAGHKKLLKYIPIPLSAEKQELLNRYKGLINSGKANTAVLRNIQNKCLTRGYFDERKMTKVDKLTWNKNLKALKITYGKLSDIDRFEGKDDQLQDKLSISELGSLSNIGSWLSNFSILE